jgi:hypothetical protein
LAAFGVRRRPIYAYLRAFAGDFTYGVNFATSGSTARNVSTWDATAKFSTPFSLNFQIQWLRRYKVRLQFYYTQTSTCLLLLAILFQPNKNSCLYLYCSEIIIIEH